MVRTNTKNWFEEKVMKSRRESTNQTGKFEKFSAELLKCIIHLKGMYPENYLKQMSTSKDSCELPNKYCRACYFPW